MVFFLSAIVITERKKEVQNGWKIRDTLAHCLQTHYLKMWIHPFIKSLYDSYESMNLTEEQDKWLRQEEKNREIVGGKIVQRILDKIDEYLFRMYDGLLKELKQTECYRDDSNKVEKLENKYPVIRKILEGEDIHKELVLSVEVQKAIKKYVELRINMLDDLQIKYYLRGFRDCISLLLKCGLLNQND